jgi:hypothetical protein
MVRVESAVALAATFVGSVVAANLATSHYGLISYSSRRWSAVRYCATPSGPKVRDAMRAGLIDAIHTPAQGNRRHQDVTWVADNGCYGAGYPGHAKWYGWLSGLVEHAARCRFAVAPDVVADAAATLERSMPWLPRIRELGYPAAFVAQDGLEHLDVPWDAFDVLFVGGSTDWKLGPPARHLVAEAKARGQWVHMGRVNSHRRLRYAAHIGCDSVDGTYVAFGPDRNLRRLLLWLREVDEQAAMDFGASS